MPRDARPSVDGAANVIKQLSSTGLSLRSEKVEDYVDLGPIDTLEKSGFIAEMQRQYNVQ